MRHNWHLHSKQGSCQTLTKESLISLVIRVGDHRDAGRKQLRSCRLDGDDASLVPKMEPVVGRVLVAVLDLRLGYRRLERPVPQRGGLSLVGLAASQVIEEEPLRNPLHSFVDGRVGERPVDRQPQIPPEILERLFVFLCEAVAKLDKVAT